MTIECARQVVRIPFQNELKDEKAILLYCYRRLQHCKRKSMSVPCNFLRRMPRYLTNAGGKQVTRDLIENEPWAKEVFDKLKAKADSYTRLTEAQPDWLLSRLAMYWNSHATDVYIKGESFDHAGGAKAPVPTVRYTGTRGTFATHGRPKLADVIPYDDDKDGNVTFHNNSLPGRPLEKSASRQDGA